MREYIQRELNESNILSWFCHRFGFLEMRLDTSSESLAFDILSCVTKATSKGSCVRFPNVEIAFKIPSYSVVERPKEGEKFRITCDSGFYHYNKRELSKAEKGVPIIDYVTQLQSEGSNLYNEYIHLLKSSVVCEMYKLLFYPVTDKEISKYLTSELYDKFKINIYDEDILNYLLDNYIELEGFKL